ncbi:class IV adenylate cyclase [Eubacteriales bacterium OttesenSCG-928-K08]|nr:class IV adenylate cyclase [Eubacteriales bacterium OttesenSCG-928-K08]
MLEIEIKAKIDDPLQIVDALIHNGFLAEKNLEETDIYYNGIDRSFAKTDEALRLRFTSSGKTTSAAITYKGPKLDKISQTRKELEVSLLDGPTMDALLRELGHTPVLTVKKQRQYYQKDKITACLDDVEGLGSYLELEMLAEEKSNRDQAVAELFAVLKALGVAQTSCTRKSYLEMLLEKLD